MSVSYYVWYQVADADDRELEQAVRSLQARLACRTGIAGRLLKRREAPNTWMEVYEEVTEPAAFERELQALVDQFDLEVRLADSRHVECFVETAGLHSEGGLMASKRGERKLQILQVLAEMLENPQAEKVTTAALAARLDVSEAALYRHFASKAQMYEGLIEFIESTLFSLINKLSTEETRGLEQVRGMLALLLGFAEKNPGMTRVLTGEALVNENERLQARMNQLFDRLEASLRQALRIAATQNELAEGVDANAAANLYLSFVHGRWQQFVKGGFRQAPTAQWDGQWPLLLRAVAP